MTTWHDLHPDPGDRPTLADVTDCAPTGKPANLPPWLADAIRRSGEVAEVLRVREQVGRDVRGRIVERWSA